MAETLKTENDGKHPKSHYLVSSGENVSDWHLRVRGMDGKPDHTLMGAAWAALHGGYRGNKYEGPNKEEAFKKLVALYHSENMPMPGMGGKATFFKSGSDTWFLGIYSNNYQDKQDEIITEKAHFDFVSWANEKGIKPPIILLHQPKFPDAVHLLLYLALETKKITPEQYNQHYMDLYKPTAIAQTKALGIKNGFVIVVGKVLPEKLEIAKKIETKEWGMSHGFIPLPKDVNIINGYRSFEFTLAPLDFAANGITAIGFSEEKMGEVLEVLPEEITNLLSKDELEETTKKAQTLIGDLLAKKTLETPAEETNPEKTEVQQPEYATLRANLAADFKLTDLEIALKTVTDKLVSQDALIETLSKAVTDLTSVVVELKKSDDQKIADAFNKPHWPSFKEKEPTAEEKAKIEEIKAELPKQIVEKTTPKDNMLAWATSGIFGQK